MQAVILAAGKGTRMLPLTETKPKPLLKVANRTILEHNLEQLREIAEEVIIVTGYKNELIENFFGNRFKDIEIKYVRQKEALGTGDALKMAAGLLKDKFLVLNGDDLYFKEDIKKVLVREPCILLKESENPENFGVVMIENNEVVEIEEKPENFRGNLVNTGLYFLNKGIFDFKIEKSKRGEYELTDYVKKISGLKFAIAENWFSLTYPWNLLDVNEFLLRNIEKKIKGKIENCYIGENVQIGEGTVIKSGSYIESNVIIGKKLKIVILVKMCK